MSFISLKIIQALKSALSGRKPFSAEKRAPCQNPWEIGPFMCWYVPTLFQQFWQILPFSRYTRALKQPFTSFAPKTGINKEPAPHKGNRLLIKIG
jgi:hypothetical protein